VHYLCGATRFAALLVIAFLLRLWQSLCVRHVLLAGHCILLLLLLQQLHT
jgi:hypothetical protein